MKAPIIQRDTEQVVPHWGDNTYARFWSKVDVKGANECWPWTASVRNRKEGYGAFWYQGRHVPATHMPFILSGFPVPKGMVVCHRCDNPCCCNPLHLCIATTQENDADKVRKGRGARHELVNTSLLTVDKVRSIRRYIAAKRECNSGRYGRRDLAEQYGVTEACISDIATMRSWKDVTP